MPMPQQSKKLASRFNGLIILSVCIAVLVSSTIITVFMLHRFNIEIHEKDALHIKGLAGAVKGILQHAFSLNYQLSVNPRIIKAVTLADPDWDRRVAIYQTGKTPSQAPGPGSGMPLLVTMHQKYDFVELLFVQDAVGDQVARSYGPLGHRGERWWFKKFVADKTYQPFFSKSYYSMTGDKPVASAFHPIYNNHRFIGIMGTDINFESLQQLVQNYLNTEDLSAIVIDNEGVIIAHPDKNKLRELYNLIDLTKNILVKSDSGGSIQSKAGYHQTVPVSLGWDPRVGRVARRALSGKSGYLENIKMDDAVCTLHYQPILLSGAGAANVNYAVILSRNTSSLNTSKLAICVFVPLFTAIVIGLLTLLIRHHIRKTILTPLEKLTVAMSGTNSTDPEPVILETHDEFEILAGTYNQMRRKLFNAHTELAELNAELEKRVEVRTEALERMNKALQADISERERIEHALRESEERYRKTFETAPDAITITEIKTGRFIQVNDAFCRLSGYSRREALDRTALELNLFEKPSDRERFIQQVKKKGEVNGIEIKYRRKDGKVYDTLLSAKQLTYGETDSLISVVTDISRRKRTEAALRESEEKYRLLAENANEAIFIFQNEKIKFPNPKARMLGTQLGLEKGWKPKLDPIHPEDREMVRKRYLKQMAGEPVQDICAFRLLTRDNDTIWVELNDVRISWGGEPATLNFLRDITLQKKLETQFRTVQRMDAIGTLAGGIAHNFNNLLMGIQGNISLLKMDNDIVRQHQDEITNIQRCIESGSNLTKQLLGYARGGKYVVEPLNPNDMVANTAMIFGNSRKEIKIHSNFAKDIRTVEVDLGQMELVLLNILVNAGQAMDGGGDIYLQTENIEINTDFAVPFKAAPGNYVRISITDTGGGMDELTLQKIFEPFFTTKPMGEGTGLGLASAFGIIKNHAGFIEVSSKMGEGSCFKIYLPASSKTIPAKIFETAQPETGSGTILVVDDEDMVAEVCRSMLKELGYLPILAHSGKRAIDLYKKHKGAIRLVILDIVMPSMDGSRVYKELKAINSDIKVLLCSGYSIDNKAAALLDEGCDGFIQKPFNIEELSRTIREIIPN